MVHGSCAVVLFFFNDTATTEIYTLSLHDALPISYIRTSPLQSQRRRPRDKADLQWCTAAPQWCTVCNSPDIGGDCSGRTKVEQDDDEIQRALWVRLPFSTPDVR